MFFKKIKNLGTSVIEGAFELALSTFGFMSKFTQTAQNLKVTVKVESTVDVADGRKKIATLALKTFKDLFTDKKRCDTKGPINIHDLLFTICIQNEKITVIATSQYIDNAGPKGEIGDVFRDFIEYANEVIEEKYTAFTIDHEELLSLNDTQRVHVLSEMFESKLRKVFFAVLVKKFIAEVGKK
ncbi:MAG: hypothetical protein WCL02_02015 [bacterium]